MPNPDFAQIRYEEPAPNIARIVLDRAEKRNAQGTIMTYELDAALERASRDPDVRVIVLAAEGDHFSAGHDLSMTRVARDHVGRLHRAGLGRHVYPRTRGLS